MDRLVRVVRLADGTLSVGRSLPGRGAWLCVDDPGCVERAIRRQAFGRAFGQPVSPESVVDLRRRMVGGAGPRQAVTSGREGSGSPMCEDGEPGSPHGNRTGKGH
ncbi:MAG: YlxR family protein [Acidimicrobiales bacterium]